MIYYGADTLDEAIYGLSYLNLGMFYLSMQY